MLPDEVQEAADPESPGIYRWSIAGAGRYIGKYSRKSRPLREYQNNVFRIIHDLPYHIAGSDYRNIHYALAHAFMQQRRIILTFLENAPDAPSLSERESALIKQFGCLNSTKQRPCQVCDCGLSTGAQCGETPATALWPLDRRPALASNARGSHG